MQEHFNKKINNNEIGAIMASENMHMTAPYSALCEKDNIGVIDMGEQSTER